MAHCPQQSAIGAPNGRSVLHTKVQLKRSLWGYQGDNLTPFLKITLSDPKFVSKLRGLFDRGEIGFGGFFDGPTATFESNIAYELRFMIDKQVRPGPSGCVVPSDERVRASR
jgi:DNA polymerase delta subunit 1